MNGKPLRNYLDYRGKAPNLRCLQVLRTCKHLKFGDFPMLAEQSRLYQNLGG
jgi:hypothetical protein